MDPSESSQGGGEGRRQSLARLAGGAEVLHAEGWESMHEDWMVLRAHAGMGRGVRLTLEMSAREAVVVHDVIEN